MDKFCNVDAGLGSGGTAWLWLAWMAAFDPLLTLERH